MRSIGISSASAAICANTVSSPWPIDGRAAIDRHRAVGLEHEPRALARAGSAAFDVAADARCRGSARRSSLPCNAAFSVQFESLQAAVERRSDSRRCRFRFSTSSGSHRGQRIRHLGFRDQVAAAELDAIDAKVPRRHVEQPLAEEIGLEAAGPAIGAGRRLVGHHQRRHRCAHAECDRAPGGPGRCCARRSRRWCGYRHRDRCGHARADRGWCRRARTRSPARIRHRGRDWWRADARGDPRSISPAGR